MSIGVRSLRLLLLGGLGAITLVALGVQSAWAEPATTCVKATKVTTPKKHYTGGYNDKACTSPNATHEGKYEKLADFSTSEEQELKALLKYLKVESSGIDGKPTVQFSGANVQVVNGMGNTHSTNGEGNLVIGYDENPHEQTGSHDLVLGEFQEFTSYGGIVAGELNSITAPFASVTGGFRNHASEWDSSITGGSENAASGEAAAVTGGVKNTSSGGHASVGGGYKNEAKANFSSVFGGKELTAKTEYEAIP